MTIENAGFLLELGGGFGLFILAVVLYAYWKK